MRPRISYIGLALAAAAGTGDVQFLNFGTVDIAINTTLPTGAPSFGLFRMDGNRVTMVGSNIPLPA
jgi:hypothetical protein